MVDLEEGSIEFTEVCELQVLGENIKQHAEMGEFYDAVVDPKPRRMRAETQGAVPEQEATTDETAAWLHQNIRSHLPLRWCVLGAPQKSRQVNSSRGDQNARIRCMAGWIWKG